MESWEIVPAMIQQPELEEGEACYYQDDTNMDPDVALSYIGDKVQNLLGHLQKDFEGGVSAENLGAKFGGYGSFLPMHQRFPSVWPHQKSPQRLQNSHPPSSPNNTPLEDPAPYPTMISDIHSTQRVGSSSPPSFCPSKNLKASSEDASVRENPLLSSKKVSEAFLGKAEVLPSKSNNPSEQRTLKVRLKLGSDRMTKYNAEILSLGLTSPSSTMGNSPEESGRLKLGSGEIPDESPMKILQIMTSFLVSGDSLLSPLCEDFLNLGGKTESLVENECETASKTCAISHSIWDKDVPRGEDVKFSDKNETLKTSENDCILDLNDFKQKNSRNGTLLCKPLPLDDFNPRASSDIACCSSDLLEEAVLLPNTVRNSEKDVPLKKRKGSKDRLKGRSTSCNLVEDASLGHGKYSQRESSFAVGQKVGEHQSVSQKDVTIHLPNSNCQVNRICAAVKSSLDIAEGEKVKLSLKVGLKAKSGELDNSGSTPDVNNFSFNNKSNVSQISDKLASDSSNILRDGSSAALKGKVNGRKENHQGNFRQKDVEISVENMDNPKRSVCKVPGDGPRSNNLDVVREKHVSADKLKERSNKTHTEKMASNTCMMEPPAEAIPFNEGIKTGTAETIVDPVLIQEDWVGCDRCEKWRLLPYGTKSKQLPDKWVCSMLYWLPGMNNCDISEDDTTSAVRASLLVPVPVNHYSFQAHAEKPLSRLSSSGARRFTPNTLNFASDPMAYQAKSQKLKEGSNTVIMSDMVPSLNAGKNLRKGDLKEMNQLLTEVKTVNRCNPQHSNKSAVSKSNLNKRKDEHAIGDDANPRKKIKKEPFQHVEKKAKRIKSKGSLDMDTFQVEDMNIDRIDCNLKSGLPVKDTVKDKKKLTVPNEKINLDKDNSQSYMKKQKDQMQDSSHNGPLNVKACNTVEVSAKIRKFKDCEDKKTRVKLLQNNMTNSREKEVFIKEEGKDEVLKKIKVGNISKNGKVSETKVVLSRCDENPTKKGINKKWQLNNLKVKLPLSKEDIYELRKDLGCDQFATAATSSSSKISDSRKNIVGFMEAKGSPEESVSSFPLRIPYMNQVLPSSMETAEKFGSSVNDFSTVSSAKRSLDVNRSSKWGMTGKSKANDIHHRSFLADNGTSILEHDHGSSTVPANCRHRKERMAEGHSISLLPQQNHKNNHDRLSICKNRRHGDTFERVETKVSNLSTGSEILDTKEKMKEEMDACDDYGAPQCEVLSSVKHPLLGDSKIKTVHHNMKSVALEESFANENASTSLKEARNALKKAEEHKTHAYLIKTSGFRSESNYEYFKAALMFLHGASLFETYNGETITNLELNPMQIYGTAAKLCESCAKEYEKSCELAAAALAFKCMEVAYLRIVYCESSSANRIWRDLLTSLQMAPQGESPSSSASDIDNLNNFVVTDRSTVHKSSESHAVNHAMFSRNRTNFVRLLDFTKVVNSAMEAAKKSQDTFAAAHAKLEESQNKKAIVSVKRVIDFSFHDVEELINSVWLALNAINCQAPAPTGGREQ